jgi:uncharacterized membrane protein required for colicin V production
MVPLENVFIGLVLLFGLIGALRGWAKELLVAFAVILARFIEFVLWAYVPGVDSALQNLATNEAETWFYVRMILFIAIVIFGYATPVISAAVGGKARKDKFQDTLLGFFLGVLNGGLVVGMVWGFLEQLGYNIWKITAPGESIPLTFSQNLITEWLAGPPLFVGVAVAFAFVLIVFV